MPWAVKEMPVIMWCGTAEGHLGPDKGSVLVVVEDVTPSGSELSDSSVVIGGGCEAKTRLPETSGPA